jgi:hypothetical protein
MCTVPLFAPKHVQEGIEQQIGVLSHELERIADTGCSRIH